MKSSRQLLTRMLEKIGVRVQGSSSCNLRINDETVYDRIISGGRLALGESYVEGCWDCEDLEELFYRAIREGIDQQIKYSWRGLFYFVKAKLLNLQRFSRARQVGEQHYDIGNDLYEKMLDSRLIYSCGYWREAEDLETAQKAKLNLICRKLRFEPGQRVLDIGCGWAGLAQYAAENYGVELVGVTVSEEQVKYGRKLCQGLPVDIRFADYRQLDEKFDRIVSVGMFEHVGVKNYRCFMEVVKRCLTKNGLFLLHTIGSKVSTHATDPWIDKYIFPNGMLPSASQITEASEGLFFLEDWHNFGPDYALTLRAWKENFQQHRDYFRERYSDKFCRMWDYYLAVSAAAFRARHNQLWQVLFSPEGSVRSDYRSVR